MIDEARVVAVCACERHSIRKDAISTIRLRAGYGVAGDAHCGTTVQHRYDRKQDPNRPNRRQVHLVGAELFDEVGALAIEPGDLGENVTTRGIAFVTLPLGTQVRLGPDAVIELTGLRNPCSHIERVLPGARSAVTASIGGLSVVRHAVMAIVLADGDVRAGDRITVQAPATPHRALPLV